MYISIKIHYDNTQAFQTHQKSQFRFSDELFSGKTNLKNQIRFLKKSFEFLINHHIPRKTPLKAHLDF